MTITAIFRVTVGYEYPKPATAPDGSVTYFDETIDDGVLALADNLPGRVTAEVFSGNGAASPYVQAEYRTAKQAVRAERRLTNYLIKQGCRIDP